MKVGVFGGTFDPPHLGHLVVAQEVQYRLELDTVLWVPAASPPHKVGQEITPGPVRMEMVRAAIGSDLRFRASDMELRRDGPSYTIDTLRELREARPNDELFLIIGADQLAELHSWRDLDGIRELATIIGFGREGDTPAEVDGVQVVPVPRIDISSTEIRRRIGNGEPVGYLVRRRVMAVVEREGLYGG
jgi:nicotinate-nucleotide adenylyltransferase